jgi:S1-C subfamily serine protease
LEVQRRVTTTNPAEKMSINRILRVGEEDAREKQCREEMPVIRTQRVLVANVRGQAGKSGIMKGDVVTHVNGEVFTGNSADLNALLVNMYEEQGRDAVVMIVVNADECTAEALRLRSRIR